MLLLFWSLLLYYRKVFCLDRFLTHIYFSSVAQIYFSSLTEIYFSSLASVRKRVGRSCNHNYNHPPLHLPLSSSCHCQTFPVGTNNIFEDRRLVRSKVFGRRDLIVENLFDRQLVIKAVMIHCDYFEMQPQELPWSTWNAQNQESLLEGDGNEKEQMLWIILTLKCDIQALWVLYSESLSMTFCFTNNQQISCRYVWEYVSIYWNIWEHVRIYGEKWNLHFWGEAQFQHCITLHCALKLNGNICTSKVSRAARYNFH